MRQRTFVSCAAVVLASGAPAFAGGLFLPGAGAESTSRAGASTVACDDGECLALNPANLMKTTGTTLTVSAVAISYAMQFTRSGTYDIDKDDPEAYNGMPYGTVVNKAKPKLGFGTFQPVPVIALTSDLGGAIPNFRAAIGLYAPNAYPFRSMDEDFVFPTNAAGDFSIAPPPTRYDIIKQDAAVLLPSVAVAYRPIPELDIGGRFSWGIANLESKTTIWANSGNVVESIQHDGQIDVKAKDNFVPTFGLGATYRVTPAIEVGANYNYKLAINAKGTATAENGAAVNLNGMAIVIGPNTGTSLCAAGGTFDAQKACVYLDIPMSAQAGGRYKFLDKDGKTVGDIELDLDWENWSDERASNYSVVVDAAAYLPGDPPTPVLGLKPTVIHHGLQDTFGARLGGSYAVDLDAQRGDQLVFRGGVGYDTNAAKTGFLRTDIDGAARTTLAAGLGYKRKTWEVNIGGGVILEGTNTNPGSCNPTVAMPGCDGSGSETPVAGRHGVDPTDPTISDANQVQSPVNQGKIESHYVMFMLGASKSF